MSKHIFPEQQHPVLRTSYPVLRTSYLVLRTSYLVPRTSYLVLRTLFLILLFLVSCTTHHPEVPAQYTQSDELPIIMPDYTSVTVPCNIAPLNFYVPGADEVVAEYRWNGQKQTYGQDEDVCIPLDEWHQMLAEAAGGDLTVQLYVQHQGAWQAMKPFTISVSRDSIDAYVSYRELPPTYVGFEELSIKQRCLESFWEQEIYNNRQANEAGEGQCINCHSYQNYHTQNMQMHLRYKNPGTIIASQGKLLRVNLKTPGMITPAIYPAWHPTQQIIAYSTGRTQQSFHTGGSIKVEVQEAGSDLIIYDIERNEVQPVLSDSMEFEVHPTWSPDGRWLYYSSAHYDWDNPTDGLELQQHYREIQYNLYRISFDAKTRSFGAPQLLYDAKSTGHSATEAWVSRDGRYVVFSEGPWGMFHIWHPTADIQVYDLQRDTLLDASVINSQQAESYPSFSSTSRWILFESRRDDGQFTRPYVAHFASDGTMQKPFLLPTENPHQWDLLMRSHSRPEFMVEPVSLEPQQIYYQSLQPAITPTEVAPRLNRISE